MPHELVVALELIALYANDRSIVGHADQEISTLRVQKRCDSLEYRVGNVPIVLPILLQVPAQRGLELQRLRLAAPYQLLRVTVRAQVLVERKFFTTSPNARSSVIRL